MSLIMCASSEFLLVESLYLNFPKCSYSPWCAKSLKTVFKMDLS